MIYLTLFWTFFKIGLFTFGGGYAMLPLIQAEVLAHGWMGSAELVNFVAVSESTPGPFAVNISTYVGTRLAGIPGACARRWAWCCRRSHHPARGALLRALPHNRIVRGCMEGLKPGVVGLIARRSSRSARRCSFPEPGNGAHQHRHGRHHRRAGHDRGVHWPYPAHVGHADCRQDHGRQ
jgi:chromate transporter